MVQQKTNIHFPISERGIDNMCTYRHSERSDESPCHQTQSTISKILNLPFGSNGLPISFSLTRINTNLLLRYVFNYFFVFKSQLSDQFRKLKLSPSDNYWFNTNDLECHYLKSQDIRRKFVSIRVLIKNWSRN